MRSLFRAKATLITLFLFASLNIGAQDGQYLWFYRVYFNDKGGKKASDYVLEDLVSAKAVERRVKSGITETNYNDIPVSKEYTGKIEAEGFKLHCTSKWMNSALFKTNTQADLNKLLSLPFVKDVRIVKSVTKSGKNIDKSDPQADLASLPPYDLPVTMVNGVPLHNSGFNGRGILIAVLDGGFSNADQISSLNGLRARKGIKYTYDFILKNKSVYGYSSHGTNVMSVLAGKIEGQIEGTAQDADYILLRTEDVSSEFPCEEDFWAAGAEYADSIGADIITSSLGYNNFDDATMDYKLSELDGNTAFVTRVADIAASKGILVVNSAGNERNKPWKQIMFPADGDSVLSVGAVDGNRVIASFSSAGPTADRRIKPDVSALGVYIPVQSNGNTTERSSGTSFSCPLIAGMAACLLQAVPEALNYDIIKAIRAGSDRYNTPDSLYGYGIPDMNLSLSLLQDRYVISPETQIVVAPNPTTDEFELIFRLPPEEFSVELISAAGKIIYSKRYSSYAGRTLVITELNNKEQGLYFVRIITNTGKRVLKVIKTRD
jgi:serine protease AprX